jgi:maleylacetate reductase
VNDTAVRILFGSGLARDHLSDEVDRLGASRVLVIATVREHLRSADLLVPLTARIAGVFTTVRPHVPVEVATAARELAAEVDADLLLAIGGGSTIGTAKAVALTTGLPILAVPTTYAGSEVTPVWGLTDRDGKRTGVDPVVRPRTVLYDPDLTMSLPIGESMVSGVNALAHCVDAFWAPNATPELAVDAADGIRMLAAGLVAIRADGNDPAGRAAALRGAMVAGQVFSHAGSGLHHKICHVLGGRYNLPHAPTHSVILPHVLAFNAPAAPAATAHIGEALGAGGSDAGAAVAALVALERRLGVPERLSDLDFDPSEIGAAAEAILPGVPASNPRPVGKTDLVEILSAAYHGVI